MERKQIAVIGSSFAGYTGAIELKRLLGAEHDVTVIAREHRFVLIPSLLWLAFGLRDEEDLTFDVRPVLSSKDITFIEREVTGFDLDGHLVQMGSEALPYDRLLIATGPKVDVESIPGLGSYSHSIWTIEGAKRSYQAWQKFLENPGPVVIGAAKGAACFSPAYEFMLHVRHILAIHGLLERVPLTFITADLSLSRCGLFGFESAELEVMRAAGERIEWRTGAVVREILPDRVVLESGEEIPSSFTMILPRFLGADPIRRTQGLANEEGFIEVDDGYQHRLHPEIFAAGMAVAVSSPKDTPLAFGVPQTGFPAERMARIAAHNIAASIRGGEKEFLPFEEIVADCYLDLANPRMVIEEEPIPDHAGLQHMAIPTEWARLGFEKYFLFARSHGYV
jgi:sulfide:quinone oxidoreductase